MSRPSNGPRAPRSNELPGAAQAGDVEGVARLLDSGVPVDAVNDQARSALDLAVQENHVDVVRLLLAAGADPALHAGYYHDHTPLTYAASLGHTPVVEALLDAGVSMRAQADRIPYTPLVTAASSNHTGTVDLLAERGADLEDRAMKGRTALEWASCFGHVEAVRRLLGHGAEATPRAFECARRHAGRDEEKRHRYERIADDLRAARAFGSAT
ncbi:ankyrin repeat domain-containing protein [Streptomyces sp. MH13]|uniref:ankyrin repeat domain-containing protein n=1 Tax=Streptomyces sp. MH13 TaxID=3417651 RepID=UPI003CFB2072